MGWRPKDEDSLAALFKFAIDTDMRAIFLALGEATPGLNDNLIALTARRIYKVRNGLVHFRPIHKSGDFSRYDWNKLCVAMGNLVFHIYTAIYETPIGQLDIETPIVA